MTQYGLKMRCINGEVILASFLIEQNGKGNGYHHVDHQGNKVVGKPHECNRQGSAGEEQEAAFYKSALMVCH